MNYICTSSVTNLHSGVTYFRKGSNYEIFPDTEHPDTPWLCYCDELEERHWMSDKFLKMCFVEE